MLVYLFRTFIFLTHLLTLLSYVQHCNKMHPTHQCKHVGYYKLYNAGFIWLDKCVKGFFYKAFRWFDQIYASRTGASHCMFPGASPYKIPPYVALCTQRWIMLFEALPHPFGLKTCRGGKRSVLDSVEKATYIVLEGKECCDLALRLAAGGWRMKRRRRGCALMQLLQRRLFE